MGNANGSFKASSFEAQLYHRLSELWLHKLALRLLETLPQELQLETEQDKGRGTEENDDLSQMSPKPPGQTRND